MNAQGAFDADVTRAMTRRQFLGRLLQASSAALVLSSGCTTVRNRMQRRRLGDAEPFTSIEQSVIAKIIDGFNPPDTEFRQLLEDEDPDYNLVEVWSDFAWAHGDAFVAHMRTLINFLDLLPTFTRTFNTRLGLPADISFRRFHTDDANRYFIFLRDSNIRTLRNIFTGARFIGTVPVYVNEKVIWKAMRYPGPWVLNPEKPLADLAAATSFDMAKETDDNVAVLRRRVVAHDALPTALEAARVVSRTDRLVLETDVVVVGSGAGGSFVAAELAAKSSQRVLVLDKGEFIEPTGFLQREDLMMPRILDTEFSVTEMFRREVPTVTAAVATGKLVGGAATINQALAFEPPRPVVRDWRDLYGATFDYSDLEPHLEAVKKLLRISPVPEAQIAGNNLALRRGVQKLGLPHHGRPPRNAHQCFGCGFCSLGCRYNRKLTPLNMVLPMAARHGAQVVANCRVDELILEPLPDDGRAGRTQRVTGVTGWLTDARGTNRERIEIRARRVVLAAGPIASPRILMQSGVPRLRLAKGSESAIGERFSTHATVTFAADFDEPLYPSAGTPPMGYYVKKYDVADQALANPERDHIRYALEGMLNHPLAHAQVVPYESAESHQALMKRFNQTMTLALMFRDQAVGRVTSRGFVYELAEEDQPHWLDSLQTGARIMFAAGGRRVFFNSPQPLILNSPEEIDTVLTLDLVRQQRIPITSGHPMGGCALGGNARRDVVDSLGRSWDVDGLYITDSSILPTSLGVNPCYTIFALSRYFAHGMLAEPRG